MIEPGPDRTRTTRMALKTSVPGGRAKQKKSTFCFHHLLYSHNSRSSLTEICGDIAHVFFPPHEKEKESMDSMDVTLLSCALHKCGTANVSSLPPSLPLSLNRVKKQKNAPGLQIERGRQKNNNGRRNDAIESKNTNKQKQRRKCVTSASFVCTPCSKPRIRWSRCISCAVRLATLCLASLSEAPPWPLPCMFRLLLLLERPRSLAPSSVTSAAFRAFSDVTWCRMIW